jgi:hypothetical protein
MNDIIIVRCFVRGNLSQSGRVSIIYSIGISENASISGQLQHARKIALRGVGSLFLATGWAGREINDTVLWFYAHRVSSVMDENSV